MAPKHRLYTPEIAETILERISDGEGLIAICRDEGMPSDGAVRHWVETDYDGFAARYAQARARGVERLADEILELSDDGARDVIKTPDGREVVNQEVVARSRLRVDSRKWLLSKLIPKTYGDKIDITADVNVKAIPDDSVQSRLADLLGKAGVVVAIGGTGETQAPPQIDHDVSRDGAAET